MEAITSYLSAHPAVLVISIILIILLLLNLFFKSLIRLVLIMLFVLLAAFGYYYFKDPSTVPEKIKESMKTIKSGVNDLEDKGKSFFKDGKELYKKTKASSGDVNKLLKDSDKETEKEFKK